MQWPKRIPPHPAPLRDLVGLHDLAPTLLAAARVRDDSDGSHRVGRGRRAGAPPFDGVSLLPLVVSHLSDLSPHSEAAPLRSREAEPSRLSGARPTTPLDAGASAASPSAAGDALARSVRSGVLVEFCRTRAALHANGWALISGIVDPRTAAQYGCTHPAADAPEAPWACAELAGSAHVAHAAIARGSLDPARARLERWLTLSHGCEGRRDAPTPAHTELAPWAIYAGHDTLAGSSQAVEQLYDLRSDPLGMHDLAASCPRALQCMRVLYRSLLEAHSDRPLHVLAPRSSGRPRYAGWRAAPSEYGPAAANSSNRWAEVESETLGCERSAWDGPAWCSSARLSDQPRRTRPTSTAKVRTPPSMQRQAHTEARRQCAAAAAANASLSSGAYCLGGDPLPTPVVGLPHNRSYMLPLGKHVPADDAILTVLQRILGGDAAGRGDGSSLLDLGAGVGQYGHSLLSRLPGLCYRGCDGAGDVEAYTDRFVRFCDLSLPLGWPPAQWVLCLEVGEHVPGAAEETVLQNVATHACEGAIVSWAIPGQAGPGHINTQPNSRIVAKMHALNLTYDAGLTAALRRGLDGGLNRSASAAWSHITRLRRQRTRQPAFQLRLSGPLTLDASGSGTSASAAGGGAPRYKYRFFANTLMAFARLDGSSLPAGCRAESSLGAASDPGAKPARQHQQHHPSAPSAPGSLARSKVWQTGYATRYFDCCKPACAWLRNAPSPLSRVRVCDSSFHTTHPNVFARSACSTHVEANASSPSALDGSGVAASRLAAGGYACADHSPWRDAQDPNLSYGFVATPAGGGSGVCGACFEFVFTGRAHDAAQDAGSARLAGKRMVVMASNVGVELAAGQFDLMVPGGGVGRFDACSARWQSRDDGDAVDLGSRFGGFLTRCRACPRPQSGRRCAMQPSNGHEAVRACVRGMCNQAFGKRGDSQGYTVLLRSCLWFADWYEAADNPEMRYRRAACPAALQQRA